jgi:hypothetical protein
MEIRIEPADITKTLRNKKRINPFKLMRVKMRVGFIIT